MQAFDLNTQILELRAHYPLLSYDPSDLSFSGPLIVDLEDNDYYKIKISIAPFPQAFPMVWETGGRIPKTEKRHIYPQTNSCCFTTSAQEQILLRSGKIKSLKEFIEKIVIKYFLNNSYYEQNGKYLNGEYSHGVQGILEGYEDILSLKSPDLILKALELRIAKRQFTRNETCFCGNKKIRKCHLQSFNQLFLIPDSTIENDYLKIAQYLLATMSLLVDLVLLNKLLALAPNPQIQP